MIVIPSDKREWIIQPSTSPGFTTAQYQAATASPATALEKTKPEMSPKRRFTIRYAPTPSVKYAIG